MIADLIAFAVGLTAGAAASLVWAIRSLRSSMLHLSTITASETMARATAPRPGGAEELAAVWAAVTGGMGGGGESLRGMRLTAEDFARLTAEEDTEP